MVSEAAGTDSGMGSAVESATSATISTVSTGKVLSKSVVSTGAWVSTISCATRVCWVASTVSTVVSVCAGSVTGVGSGSTVSVLSTTTCSTGSTTGATSGVTSKAEVSSAARVRSPTSTIPESSSSGEVATLSSRAGADLSDVSTCSSCASSG